VRSAISRGVNARRCDLPSWSYQARTQTVRSYQPYSARNIIKRARQIIGAISETESKKESKQMKRLLVIAACIVILISACASLNTDTTHARAKTPVVHAKMPAASVCVDTGLTGPAEQENTLFCATNAITGQPVNCCTSVYQQAIHLAQQKGIVVRTPEFLSQSVTWGVPTVVVTMVQFTSSYYAWHFDPSNGIATIEDTNNHVVYSGR